jgi:isoquinoline 1-oxidoreductase beta subunit
MNDMTDVLSMNRRRFVIGAAGVGGGLSLGLQLPFGPAEAQAATPAATPEVNAWVVIRPDDTVVIRIARSEMGQGTLTGLAQLVAEELECDWSKVTTEYPTPGENVRRNRIWRDFSTGGSRGIRTSHEYVREGGAAARMMLIQAAADQWKVPADECTAANSVITHGPSKRKTTYGKVALAASKLEVPKGVKLKDPKEWKIVGKSVKRLDTRPKVMGAQIYGADLRMPGMLNAAIRDCPVQGGTVRSFDASKVTGMKGVRHVLQVGRSAVAVVADTWWQAKTALAALPIDFDEGPNAQVSSADIAARLTEGLSAEQAFTGNSAGNAKAALSSAARTIEATYAYPFLNHATMEPMNATALYTADKLEVWVPTQNGEASFAAAVEASGLPAGKVDVYKINLGGGFGRRGFQDYVVQAVLLAKQLPGVPVKLLWSREEDMTHGRYHPVMQAKLVGGLDAQNNLSALHLRLSGQSILADVFPANLVNGMDPLTFQGMATQGEHGFGYTVPNLLIDHAMRNTHMKPGFWRGVNANQNAIFLECFIDELAEAAGKDAVEFRRALTANHPRNRGVLEAVVEGIGWSKPAAPGIFRGVAQMKAFGSFVAAAAEISVEGGNKIKLHRIVAATDPGYAVNPAQIERQIAGSFVYGLSALFLQECTVKDGRIEQQNFDTFGSMHIRHMPKVECIVMPTGGSEPWGGIGEPTICVAAPAVLNAFYRATGKRIRSFPLKNQGITFA